MNLDPTTSLPEYQVLIVGAGPVGLTLAIDLGQRGVRCLLIEEQSEPRRLPKMERCNARTMEIYRRLGLADAIRAAGAPLDARMDIVICTNMAEEPILRLNYPSAAEVATEIAASCDGTLPLEAAHLVSQYSLEPLLMDVARRTPNVTVKTGCALRTFVQDSNGVTAQVVFADGKPGTVTASYLVGTDGGRSTVRKQLGIQLLGEGGLAKKNQVFVHCDKLWEVCPHPQGRIYNFTNEDQSIVSMQDSLKHFVFHTNCFGTEAELRELIAETLGLDVDFEILATTAWTLHLLVAERYFDGRVFLAGDAVHLVIPTGGLGLNTGIGDAADLGWKLAATLQGWGGPNLLPSYNVERRAIGLRTCEASRYAALGLVAWRQIVRPEIREDTPEGRGTKAAVAYVAQREQRKLNEQVGTELGYRYESSPIVCSEDGPWPPDVREVYIPTARPGARLPHMWLADGSAFHDRIGKGYTLVKCGEATIDPSAFESAIRALGVPLDVLEIGDPALRAVYRRDLLLLRPDLHVCWRGDALPSDPSAVAQRVVGFGPTEMTEVEASPPSAKPAQPVSYAF
jgi:2-polyprenyl-6-methoxyphenol hydroxylase-like FAD-dependent oxidoreductase